MLLLLLLLLRLTQRVMHGFSRVGVRAAEAGSTLLEFSAEVHGGGWHVGDVRARS